MTDVGTCVTGLAEVGALVGTREGVAVGGSEGDWEGDIGLAVDNVGERVTGAEVEGSEVDLVGWEDGKSVG